MTTLIQTYDKNKNVLHAAQERISFIFDNYEKVIVSISGGKDSTILAWLAVKEAEKRNRRIGMFFLDEEVVYGTTIKQVEYLMGLSDCIEPMWYQIPFALTNSVSKSESQLITWEEDKRPVWMRKNKRANAVKFPPWGDDVKVADKSVGFRFYDAIPAFESLHKDTAFLVGLRADESLNRYRAMVKNPIDVNGEKVYYATRRCNGSATFYPIYDWTFSDVWRLISQESIQYSKMYDWQYMLGMGINEMRCSSLIHEKSFKSICELPSFEPKTYQKLLNRIKGIGFAQETGKDAKMFACRKLPKEFKSWIEYRDYLLETYPIEQQKERFTKRFKGQLNNNYVCRQQCRQMVLGDYENNLPVHNVKDPRDVKIQYYKEIF